MTDWNPEHDLAALLDRLTEELLTAADHEIAPYLSGTGDGAAEAMRRLVAAADADFVVLPVSGFVTQGLRDFMTRNQ
jgi:hypothetical protein